MVVANIEDLRSLARRRLPRALFDFVDGGAQDDVTLRANQSDFQRLALVPRVLSDVCERDQSVTVLGQQLEQPLILAPTGMPGILWPHGALAAAQAAEGRRRILPEYDVQFHDRNPQGQPRTWITNSYATSKETDA